MRRLGVLPPALLITACAAPQPAIPLVILPGLEKTVEAAPAPSTAPLPATSAAPPPAPPTPATRPPTERRPAPATGPPQAAVEKITRAPLPLFPTPEGRLAYLGGRFSFDLPRGWKAPVEAPGGAALVDGDGRAGAGAAFHPQDSPEWRDAADFRRSLRTQGSVEDSPLLETVTVGRWYGTRRRWTTHRYKGPRLTLGKDAEVLLTETLLVPDVDGIYVFWFRAPKEEFPARRAGFAELLKSLRLPPPGPDTWRPTPKERRRAVPAWD